MTGLRLRVEGDDADLDDVVIEAGSCLVHLERMDARTFWLGVMLAGSGDERIALSLWVERGRLRCRLIEAPGLERVLR